MFMIWGGARGIVTSGWCKGWLHTSTVGAAALAPPHLLEGVLKERLPGNADLHMAGQRVRLQARQRHEALWQLAQQLLSPTGSGIHAPISTAALSWQGPLATLLTWHRKRNWWYFQRKLRSYAPGEPPCLLLQKQHRPCLSIPDCPGVNCLVPAASWPAEQEENLWDTALFYQSQTQASKPTARCLCNKADPLPPLSVTTTGRHKLRAGSPSSQCAAWLQDKGLSP